MNRYRKGAENVRSNLLPTPPTDTLNRILTAEFSNPDSKDVTYLTRRLPHAVFDVSLANGDHFIIKFTQEPAGRDRLRRDICMHRYVRA